MMYLQAIDHMLELIYQAFLQQAKKKGLAQSMIKGKDQKNSGNKEKRILVGRLKQKTEYMRD